MSDNKIMIQRVWGVLLVLAGIVMFIKIPGRVNELKTVYNVSKLQGAFFLIGGYVISIILFIGGSKKIWTYFRLTKNSTDNNEK